MTTTDEYVPSDDQVRGRYCDGTYAQTGHTTEGEDFDAWLARVREDVEAELDSWMARAYEAEKHARQAEARVKAVRDLCDDADKRHASVLIVTKVRRALDT